MFGRFQIEGGFLFTQIGVHCLNQSSIQELFDLPNGFGAQLKEILTRMDKEYDATILRPGVSARDRGLERLVCRHRWHTWYRAVENVYAGTVVVDALHSNGLDQDLHDLCNYYGVAKKLLLRDIEDQLAKIRSDAISFFHIEPPWKLSAKSRKKMSKFQGTKNPPTRIATE